MTTAKRTYYASHRPSEEFCLPNQANAEPVITLRSLGEMERTGGEPDVVGHHNKTGEYIFYDCSAESPKDRMAGLIPTRHGWCSAGSLA
jgi:Protein of unknown function (DUF4256)